jgi:hypothetical protein
MKDYRKKDETGDFLSINWYKMEMMLGEEEDLFNFFDFLHVTTSEMYL